MKHLIYIVMILLFSSAIYGQENRPEKLNSVRLESPRTAKPKLSLQKAVRLADKFIEKEKIDASAHYLWRIQLIQYGSTESDKKPAWHFWWVGEKGLGDYIEIIVFMDGRVIRVPSM